MTVVFYTHCQKLNDVVFRKELSKLPDEMIAKNQAFRRWQDAHAHLYGKLLLEIGFGYFGIKRSLKDLVTSKYGKPYFINQNFSFNISHSGDYIVCIISEDEKVNLGIDLEKVNPIPIDEFKNVWTSKEKEELTDLGQFYSLWTRKEAVIKAEGLGMQIPLTDIDVTRPITKVGGKLYLLQEVFFNEEYKMHVASITELGLIHLIHCPF